MGELRDNLTYNLNRLLDDNKSIMSKKQFAEALGVSQSAVTNWIKGNNSPDIELIAKICDLFNVSINQLIDTPNNGNNLFLTSHEKSVILAYRSRIDMQKAIDTLLGLVPNNVIEIKSVARSSDNHGMYKEKISKADLENLQLQQQPSSDDEL